MLGVVLIGFGNIGLSLADFIARNKDVRSVVLVDPDDYANENVSGQLISPRLAGKAKVLVAAERMKEVNPALEIQSWKCRLQELARGWFLNRIVISALDTRHARAALSRICFAARTVLWLDTGVRPDGRITRVSVISPSSPAAACLCCPWGEKDWDALSAEFSCNGTVKGAPTGAPAYLGAAAGAQTAELLERHIAGTLERGPEVRHYLASLTAHKNWITHVAKNPACRSSHEQWEIAKSMPRNLAIESARLSVPGFPFVRNLRCSCGAEKAILYVAARLDAHQMRCPACGRPMHYGAFDLIDEIDFSALEDYGPENEALALAGIGVVEHDVVRIGGNRYFEMGASARSM
jgi:hypothetical protein